MGLPVLALAGDEVLWALLRAGFVVVKRTESLIVLERSLRLVALPVLPAASPLAPETLSSLLRDAGVSYSELLELIGEAPTSPASPTAGASGVRLKRRRR